MRRFLACLLIVAALVLISCATGSDSNPLKGVWEANDNGVDYIFTFTADGAFAFEFYSDGIRAFTEFGYYESDDSYIYTDEYDYAYTWFGKNLILSYYGNDITLKRTSTTAKNNTTPAKLKGVWSYEDSVVGFSSGGTFVTRGAKLCLDGYSVQGTDVTVAGNAFDYLIINSKLYIHDDADLFGSSYTVVLERITSEGKDQTSRDMLTQNSPWHLVDTYNGTEHYIYSFTQGGKYKMEYYTDFNMDESQTEGKFKYNDHVIDLSENAPLAFVIIDLKPFMFTL